MMRGMEAGMNLRRMAGVSWPMLLLVIALVIVACAATAAGTAYWVIKRYTLHMPLDNQRLNVQLPEQLPVEVEILQQDNAVMTDASEMRAFPVLIDENFRSRVRVDTRVPIRMNVPFKGEVPVDITVPVDTTVKTRVLGINMELPITASIPLRFNLPVDLVIPIEQTVPMHLDLPVNTHIKQQVTVRVQTRQAARIRLQEPVLEVDLQGSEIAVPLSWVSLTAPANNGNPVTLGPMREETDRQSSRQSARQSTRSPK